MPVKRASPAFFAQSKALIISSIVAFTTFKTITGKERKIELEQSLALFAQGKDVAEGIQEPRVGQLDDYLFTHAVDVHLAHRPWQHPPQPILAGHLLVAAQKGDEGVAIRGVPGDRQAAAFEKFDHLHG